VGQLPLPGLDRLGRSKETLGRARQPAGPLCVRERGAGDLAGVVEDDRNLDLGGDLGQVGECLLGVHDRRA
jgi:hypothetical protein